VLGAAVPVREVAACDDEVGLGLLDETSKRRLDLPFLIRSRMQIGDVEDAYWRHRGRRL